MDAELSKNFLSILTGCQNSQAKKEKKYLFTTFLSTLKTEIDTLAELNSIVASETIASTTANLSVFTNDAGFIAADNVSGSYVRGTELVWTSSVLNRFQCTGNWTFQRSKVTGEKRKYYRDKKLPNRPENYGSVKIEYLFKNITPFWALNRKSSYFLDRSNQEHNRYPGRTLHNTGVIVSFLGGRTKCTALIKNITDVLTFDIQGMPKPGRSYMIKFVYTI